jgi:hypothetical protein
MKFAKENSLEWWIDELDCTKSFQRQRIDMSFEEVLKKFKLTSHFVVINRHNEYGEIGFCTFKEPDYFLWINVNLEIFHEITKKFDLHKK